jgi:ATP-dependent DNA helicase DinG
MSTVPTNFEQAEAMLALELPGYAPRITQQRAAAAVEAALAIREHLLLQAGTGTGKSLALMIPAILAGKRVIVSTATKALQLQYINKDLPFLAKYLGVHIPYALLQGRSNYFCKWRAQLVLVEEPLVARMLEEAEAGTEGFSGVRSDFSFDIPDALWSKVCSEADDCSELGCKNLRGCWVNHARSLAALAKVVVVNHALLASDAASEFNALLGEYHVLVCDEVHELPDYAIGAFETYFSEFSVKTLQARVHNFITKAYAGISLKAVSQSLTEATGLYWLALTSQMPEKEEKLRITPDVIVKSEDEWVNLSGALWAYAKAVEDLPLPLDEDDAKRYRMLKNRAQNLAIKFDGLIRDEFTTTVRWVEWATHARDGRKYLVVRSQPIEVGPFLQQSLFKNRVLIGASATVAPGGKFDFVAGRLGFTNGDGYRGLDVGTNFDYPNQALTYIPQLPSPSGATAREWEAALGAQVQALVQASRGRALVLFTSIRQMNRVYNEIAGSLPWTVYKQGDMPTPRLVDAFKADTHSVLFATKTFFTGIDIQGEALSLVVLDKLPFPTPSDPVVEATCELYNLRYGNRADFNRYMVPFTQMALEQAYGRLIRTISDRGVFACLDSRLLKTWGASMAAKLPPARRTQSLDDVRAFFQE